MITKRILVPDRLRRPPATGWSWTDGRFVREHMDHLSREAVLLYFFLSAVADVNGLSFYGDGTVAARLRMPLPSLLQARDELLAYDLIAHEPPLTQVLSLPPPLQPAGPSPAAGYATGRYPFLFFFFQAVRNVQDRERKWLSRSTLDGRKKRAIEYEAARQFRSQRQHRAAAVPPRAPPG